MESKPAQFEQQRETMATCLEEQLFSKLIFTATGRFFLFSNIGLEMTASSQDLMGEAHAGI